MKTLRIRIKSECIIQVESEIVGLPEWLVDRKDSFCKAGIRALMPKDACCLVESNALIQADLLPEPDQ